MQILIKEGIMAMIFLDHGSIITQGYLPITLTAYSETLGATPTKPTLVFTHMIGVPVASWHTRFSIVHGLTYTFTGDKANLLTILAT
jgi:hypothetical protein